MKISVVPGDRAIIVNGESLVFDYQVFPATLHAIQWHGTSGTLEFATGPQQWFDNFAIVEPYLDAWNAEKARIEAEALANA